MKAAKPTRPTNAPAGTVWFGGPIEWFKISLFVSGEDLVPEEITAIMLREPSHSCQKGKPLYRSDGSVRRVPKGGSWVLTLVPDDTDEWNCGEAMLELLASLPSDPVIWRDLAARYEISLFVGLRMVDTNKGFRFSPDFLTYLGERRIFADFDVYYKPEEEG